LISSKLASSFKFSLNRRRIESTFFFFFSLWSVFAWDSW
jgi:hypothetical protein